MTFEILSDHEFELLVGDLLGSRNGCIFETFTRGPDGGIDLRFIDHNGHLTIVQCKHMEGSTVSQVRTAAKKEADSWKNIASRPEIYIFVTSKGLTPANKDELHEVLECVSTRTVEILGGTDVNTLLRAFPDVQRNHVKLWLSNAEQLQAMLHSGIAERSGFMLEEISSNLETYVNTSAFGEAKMQLHSNNVIIISGPPGVGKSTLAEVLAADATTDGYELVVVSADADEADKVFRKSSKQIFYYDDFLGTNILGDRIAKNEDKRLSGLIRRCAQSPSHLLIMTTREYILQQALSWYEDLHRAGIPLHKYTLELNSYSRYERAQIFISHVRQSPSIDRRALISVLKQRRYDMIIDHPNYSPRLIEYVTGRSFYELQPSDTDNYFSFVMTTFGDPNIVWSRAFENQIDDYARIFVVAIAAADRTSSWDSVISHYRRMCEQAGLSPLKVREKEVFQTLEGSFVTSRYDNSTVYLQLANPGLSDLVATWLARNTSVAELAIQAASTLEQLEWLVDRVVGSIPSDDAQDRMVSKLIDRIVGLWDSKPSQGPYRYQASDAWTLTRLSLALKIYSLNQTTHEYGQWIYLKLAGSVRALFIEPYFPLLAAKVVQQALQCGFEITNFAEAVVNRTREEAFYLDAWECILQVRDQLPNILNEQLQSELASECRDWATDELSVDVSFFKDAGDIEDIVEICTELGADVDEALISSAMDQVGAVTETERKTGLRGFTTTHTVKPVDEGELIQNLLLEALRTKSSFA